MSPQVILGLIVAVPVVLLLVLRINAALVFLSLCLGNVLVQFVAPDAKSFMDLFSARLPQGAGAGNDNIKLILLLFPVVLTAIFMIRTVNGKGRLVLNLLPAAGVGLLGGLLVVPLLPGGLSHDIVGSSLWDQVLRAQDLIVGVSALICLLVLWLQRPKTGHDKHGKKH
jgi:Na+(H+)/acetate symporter ActP